MKCEKCSFDNVEEARTCRGCGNSLTEGPLKQRVNYNNISIFSILTRGFEKIIESIVGTLRGGPAIDAVRGDSVENPVGKLSFSNAVKLGFRECFQFEGRSSRRAYWWWVLFARCVVFGVFIVDSLLPNTVGEDNTLVITVYGVVVLALSILILIPTLAVSMRRLHDVGKTGWWILPIEFALTVTTFFLTAGVYTLYALLRDGETVFPEGVPWVPYILIFGVVPLILTILSILWWVDWFAARGNSGANQYGSVPSDVVDG